MTGRNLGWLVFIAGLLFVNYVYLHDLIWQQHGGFIVMGIKSYAGAAVGTVVTLIGAAILHRQGGRG